MRGQQKRPLAGIYFGIDGEVMRTEIPVSVVSHSIPKFFLQDLSAGFQTRSDISRSFSVRVQSISSARISVREGMLQLLISGDDTAIFKESETNRVVRM